MGKKLEVEVVGNTKDFDRAMDKASGKTQKFGSTLGSLGKAGAIGAAAGGLALLGKGLFDSVGAALEAEKAEVRFKDAMDKVGASAKQREAAQAAVNKVSRQAALDDEDLSDVYSKLVRTTGDVTKAQEGMALAADIARARNISLEAASKLVEKAYLGNEQAFKKVGLEVEKGTTATETLERAQKKFAGSAEAYGNSAAGAQDKLGVAFENLQEKIGQKLLPVIQRLAIKLTELVTWAEANWPRFAKSIQPVIDQMDEVWKVIQKVWAVAQPILEVALPLAFKLIGTQIKIMLEVFQLMEKVVSVVIVNTLKVVDKFLGGFQAIAEAASHLPFVGDKFKGVSESIGHAREKVRELAESIDKLHDKDISVTLTTVYKERHEELPGGPIGRRAAGGPVRAGMPYIVGERGKELFVPGQSGRIVPNGGSGGDSGGGWGSGDIVIKIGEVEIARAVRNGNQRLRTQGSAV